ncbi:major facilitator transporter [Saccharopolyspora erythraea D]|nr:MFS transporter [Saccharopolyspora erythraea]EQD81849.1 major facilitator transporter [Saccharopolyspora erythraea D]
MTDTTNSTTAPATAPPGRAKTLLGTGVGNALEWYDWGIYAIFVPYIATRFFDNSDQLSALLSALAVFAVGFLARPFGGWLFGLISDRWGRRNAMTLSVAGAAGGTVLIGLSPAYDAIGAGASVVLLLARLMQGVAHGGELPSAQTYISEVAPDRHRGLWSSLIYFSGTIGLITGTALGAVLTTALTDQQMSAWGWRIPFLLGGVVGLYALVMRRRMEESAAFRRLTAQTSTADREPMGRAILRSRRQALQVIGMTIGLTVAFYAWGTAATQFAISSRGVPPSGALWAGVAAQVVFIAALPLWGALSDRIGRKPVALISIVGLAVAGFPLNALLDNSPWRLFVAMSLAMVLMAASASIMPAMFAELFPTRIRTVGVAVPYSSAVALFGGTAPYLQAWLETFSGPWFTGYVSLLLVVSAVTLVSMPETRGTPLR